MGLNFSFFTFKKEKKKHYFFAFFFLSAASTAFSPTRALIFKTASANSSSASFFFSFWLSPKPPATAYPLDHPFKKKNLALYKDFKLSSDKKV
jgi:hypothetical protein